MASSRDRLKAANAKNAQTRGETSTDSTVFSDFANRIDETNNDSENKDPVNTDIKTDVKEIQTPPVKTKATVKKSVKKTENISGSDKSEQNNISQEEKSDKETNSIPKSKEFTGKLVMLSVSIPEEISEYLDIKSAMIPTSIKNLFMNIIMDVKDKPLDLELVSKFRRRQYYNIKRPIQVSEDFRELVKTEAAKFKMKQTAFISYCLTKAYNEDSDYKKAMEDETK